MKELHIALRELKFRAENKLLHRQNYGICHNLNHVCLGLDIRIVDIDMYELMRDWPEHSGADTYPVPSPTMPHDALAAIHAYMSTHDVWAGEYGEARMRLLDFLIEKTKP